MMKAPYVFLLLYAVLSGPGLSWVEAQIDTCDGSSLGQQQCGNISDSTSRFLQCAGVPSGPLAGPHHVQNLVTLLDAVLDVYSFMRTALSQGPALELWAGIELTPEGLVSDADVLKVWLEVKMKPLLSSVSQQFLQCLGNKNLSCEAYHTVVSEMSHHFSGMDPVRQRWIYMFFMYPFLSDSRTAGCMHLSNSSEDWLMRNFGSFSVMATMKDLSSINMIFSGLDVLHLLTPEQKAELLLHPEVAGLDEGTLSLVFDSLLDPLMPTRPPLPGGPPYHHPTSTPFPDYTHNYNMIYMTTDGPYYTQYYPLTYRDPAREVANEVMSVLTPVGNFARHLVSFTNQYDLHNITSATLIQSMLNWTLAELAAPYKQNTTTPDEVTFDPLDVNDWFLHVVVPVLRRYLPRDQMEIPQNITATFHHLFHIQNGMDPNSEETDSDSDICSVSIDKRSCALTDAVEEVARVMHCAAKTNLSLSEETFLRLLQELSSSLNSLLQELTQTDFTSPDSPFSGILDKIISGPLTQENLHDVSFIRLWFQIKLRPLLPSLSPEYLSCLSAKGFSCETYQALVKALGDHMSDMHEDGPEMVLQHFIIPFLSNPNHTDPGCVRSSENSTDWLLKNMGRFSRLGTLVDMYQLNPNFSALEVMPLLSPRQMAELMVVPLPRLPPKREVVDRVFDRLLTDPMGTDMPEVLEHLVRLSHDMGMDCESYQTIVLKLYDVLWSVPRMLEPQVWAAIHNMRQPPNCPLPVYSECPVIHFNESRMCAGINSSELQRHLEAGLVPCEYTLMQYACSELKRFTAQNLTHLLVCKLSSNMTDSRETWKLLLTKTSAVLDEALLMFSHMPSNMSHALVGPSVSNFLDVLRDMRLDQLSPEQWQDASYVMSLFNSTLRPFLSSASGGFLHCLSTKNLTCETYQHILRAFVRQFHYMDEKQRRMVVDSFILPYLQSNSSEHGCALNDSYEWLQRNFGPFSIFVELEDLFQLNMVFEPLSVLDLLSPKQMAVLMVLPLPHAQGKDEVINRVLDHLLESPVERNLPEVLGQVITLATEEKVPCEIYQTLIPRLNGALASVPGDLEPIIREAVEELFQLSPIDCPIDLPIECPTIPVNESQICEGVNSTALQSHLATGLVPCNASLEQYACAQLSGLTAENLTHLLVCKLSSNMTSSRETWKLLLTKTSAVLDEALIMFSNMSLPVLGPSATHVLDVLGELRLELVTNPQWKDISLISSVFGDKLRPFLPFASRDFLRCVSDKNLTCETYQFIVGELNHQYDHMTEDQKEGFLRFFILPFLSRNTSDPGCISNNSKEWLINNYGQFYGPVPLQSLLDVNKYFSPLSVLELLSPQQKAELILLPLPGLPPKEEVIRVVFNHLLEAPLERQMPEVLHQLSRISEQNEIPCSSLQLVSENLYMALSYVPAELDSNIYTTADQLKMNSPQDCRLPSPPSCPLTRAIETEICNNINSSQLQQLLDVGQVPCQYSLSEYACAQLSGLTAEHLAKLLVCKLSSNMTSSKETWKLLFTKTSAVLDKALLLFTNMASNMSLPIHGPSASAALDVFREMRLDRLTAQQWQQANLTTALFMDSLRPLLPFASTEFLSCITENLSCGTYQYMVSVFSNGFDHLEERHRETILEDFIRVYLTNTSACLSNDSVEWLQNNLGQFSTLLSLDDLFQLNMDFSPLSTLEFLSSSQMAELMLLTSSGPSGQVEIINTVFDHLTADGQKLPGVLRRLVTLSKQVMIPCEAYVALFGRLYDLLPYEPREVEPHIWATIDRLMQTSPRECLPADLTCPITPLNESGVCAGANTSALQSHLSAGMITCNYSVEQYACAQLAGFTAADLVSLLQCQLSSDVVQSKESWKVLLTKTSAVLDEALGILSNMSVTFSGPSVPLVLDVIREMRFDLLDPHTMGAVSTWFGKYLRPFLSSPSGVFLHCISSRNLSCATYQFILNQFARQFDHMDEDRAMIVLKYYVRPFLNSTACASNNSAEWLEDNLGPYAVYVPVNELLTLNPVFTPLEVLNVLTPVQLTELMVAPLPGLSDKEAVINTVFDHLAAAPEEKLPEVLQGIVTVSAKPGAIPCSSYKVMFNRMDQLIPVVTVALETAITSAKTTLLTRVPPGCVIYSGECNVTPINETKICLSVNSTALQHHLDNQVSSSLCSYSIAQYACAELSALTAEDLVTLFNCKVSEDAPKETWKLFITKVNPILGHALDLFNSTNLTPSATVSRALDAIGEVTFSTFSTEHVRDVAYVSRWFQTRLRPFLPSVTPAFLSCLATKDFSCQTYQEVVQAMGEVYGEMANSTLVYTDFIEVYLNKSTADCAAGISNSADWLEKNLGPFSVAASVVDMQRLHPSFSLTEALPRLALRQLVEASATPGLLTSAAEVTTLMGYVSNQDLDNYFDMLAPAAQVNPIAAPLRSAMLQQVFDRANLSVSSVPDAEVLVWLNNRLAFLLPDLMPSHVAPYFNIIRLRQCNTTQQAVALLNGTLSTLPDDTKTEVYSHIVALLKEPTPLRCYGSGSFYSFLESSFMGFQFPNLTTFLSLVPANRKPELMNSIPPAQLGSFLRRPNSVDNTANLCQVFEGYTQTLQFLETESLPAMIQPHVLPCVWSQALAANTTADADRWFDTGLSPYLSYLNKDLISYTALQDANCLAFRKFVVVTGNHNYSSSGFSQQDVYSTIRSYLSAGGPKPICYKASIPVLSSTAWFVNYINIFIKFITLGDLISYGNAELQIFTTNMENLQLFNQTTVPQNVTDFYVDLLYQQSPTFSPIYLPLAFRCSAPAIAFTNLTINEMMVISRGLSDVCGQVEQDLAAALSSSVENISPTYISALGNSSTGFSIGQLGNADPMAIFSSLSVLSTVVGWNQGQAMILVQKLISSGHFQITNSNHLQSLGTLISGVPSAIINSISSTEILTASQSVTLVNNLISAPTIIQQTFVTKIISVNTEPVSIINNVPNALATQIPRNFLQGFTQSAEVVTKLNQKTWTQSQSVLIFDTVASAMDNANDISFQVLQGFTCTRVQTLTKIKIKSLIKGCRQRRDQKLKLRQTQLTCMYYRLRGEPEAAEYSELPADVLLYYNYDDVTNCTSYFTELGFADFSVLSQVYESRKTTLVNNAKACLGITGSSISAANLNILGNMVCLLDGSYVQNSDPSIIEKLKNCDDLSSSLVTGMETLLLSGNTTYGVPSTWIDETLESLDPLPLYFTSNLWREINKRQGSRFLKSFIRKQRRQGDSRTKIQYMKRQYQNAHRSKRETATECTVGTITQVHVNDDTFPLNYDTTQFNACLSVTTLKDNLAAITEKADDESYHKIILQKLNQAYPGGISDDMVQLLGPVSRGATTDDISKWNVTKIDTLSSLMKSSDGHWSENQTKAIMTKYLAAGNSIDKSVLNSLGGSGVCYLDTTVLEGISSSSLQQADALTISSCSLAKKKVLFPIAQAAFIGRNTSRSTTTVTRTEYQLIESYTGGAPESFVRTLVSSNISMDMDTFLGLDQSVIQTLGVSDVRNLLGVTNVNDLSTYSRNTIIQDWISRQFQTDLDTLGLGLTGGRASPDAATTVNVGGNNGNATTAGSSGAAATGAAATTTTTTTTTTTKTTATTATTASGGASVRPASGLHCLLLATVFTALCTFLLH